MPSLTVPVAPQGPLIQVLLGVSAPKRKALTDAGSPVPAIIPATALVDTGASHTVIDPGLATQLGLTPTGSAPMITPSTGNTPVSCSIFDVSLAIVAGPPSNIKLLFHNACMPVSESALAHQGFEVLLGRDVLASAMLVYNGSSNTLMLGF